jgi:hypothetical protein
MIAGRIANRFRDARRAASHGEMLHGSLRLPRDEEADRAGIRRRTLRLRVMNRQSNRLAGVQPYAGTLWKNHRLVAGHPCADDGSRRTRDDRRPDQRAVAGLERPPTDPLRRVESCWQFERVDGLVDGVLRGHTQPYIRCCAVRCLRPWCAARRITEGCAIIGPVRDQAGFVRRERAIVGEIRGAGRGVPYRHAVQQHRLLDGLRYAVRLVEIVEPRRGAAVAVTRHAVPVEHGRDRAIPRNAVDARVGRAVDGTDGDRQRGSERYADGRPHQLTGVFMSVWISAAESARL